MRASSIVDGIRRAALAACCVLILAFLAGCNAEKTNPAAASEAGKTPAAPAKPAAEPKHALKLAGMIYQEDQFFRLVQFGMKDAAAKAGVEFMTENNQFRLEREIQLINTYVGLGVDAIITSPISMNGSYTALKKAHDAGVKLVTYNTPIKEEISESYIESDQFALGASTGKVAADYVQKNLGGKAKLAILAFKTANPEQSELRVSGFKSEIQKLPGVELVAEQDAWLADMSTKKTGDILNAHPDITIIWSANEGGTVGAVMAVKNAGKAGQVAVFGTDASDQLADFLLSGDNVLQAITGQQPFEIGSLAVNNAIKVLRGEPVEKKVSLPGLLLRRDRPDEVSKFKARLKELIK